jgi:formamidopyrimidine-DNA glycosylase
MPELPEVETVRRALAAKLVGRRITRVEVRRSDLRLPLPEDFAARLEGRRVTGVARRAKYLLIGLDGGGVLLAHLGMSGRMLLFDGAPPPPGPHDHVIVETDAGTTLYFNDARRFGLMTLSDEGKLASHPLLRHLGPEPLSEALNGPALAAALAGRNATIKAALFDQRIMAGLGNIYICESLFRAGLSPRRRAGTVVGKRAERLTRAIKSVLGQAIAAGGATLRDYRQPTGELGYFQHAFAVYGRQGEPCPGCDCDMARTGGIRRIVQSARSTFFCPRRQR